MIAVQIRLFGALRKYANGSEVEITVPVNASLAEVRRALCDKLKGLHPGFSDEALVLQSALADERAVLGEDQIIQRGAPLAILPPVCGG